MTVPEEKGPSFNFITQMFKEIGHILQRKKNHDWKPRSLQYLGYHENILIVLSLQHLETSVLL